MLIGLGLTLAALMLFAVLVYDAPLLAALAAIGGSLLMMAILLAHLWARERREARG
jgi:hypothetical protein